MDVKMILVLVWTLVLQVLEQGENRYLDRNPIYRPSISIKALGTQALVKASSRIAWRVWKTAPQRDWPPGYK